MCKTFPSYDDVCSDYSAFMPIIVVFSALFVIIKASPEALAVSSYLLLVLVSVLLVVEGN
jgi:hypothetical protein